MWFMNKIANPFVRLILRSPLHRLMSAVLLLITYRGRKSGRKYTLPVQYVRRENEIYIIPGMAATKTWWRNLRGGARVELTLAGQTVHGQAVVLQGEAEIPAIADALRIYLEHFPAAAKMHAIAVGADGAYNPDDLRRAAASLVLVRVDLASS